MKTNQNKMFRKDEITLKKDLSFEEFSKKIENMNERCGSCKHLEYRGENSYCTKHNVEQSNKSPRCKDWRYFA